MSKNSLDQILNVYKPAGISSYDVVRRVKRLIPDVKVGHGGTLDPFAEGVLLILVGKATKRMPDLLRRRKRYHALLKLGIGTATGDHTGSIQTTTPVPAISGELLRTVEGKFTGDITQIPPRYSAKKIKGRPAYKYARAGQPVQLEPIHITVHDLTLNLVERDLLRIVVTCSSGTYIRVLGEDIARMLGTCGHLVALQRTAIGDYRIEDCIALDQLPEFIPGEVIARASN